MENESVESLFVDRQADRQRERERERELGKREKNERPKAYESHFEDKER